MLAGLTLLAVVGLAAANGANDNFKGVATLFGSGTCRYRTALIWATVTTLAGSMVALVLAAGLVQTFSGKGLVPDSVAGETRFLAAVSLGAAATVALATRVGMPVSTTHALTGGLVGAGWFAASGDVRVAALGGSFALPLLVSPGVSLALAAVAYPVFRTGRRVSGVTGETCVCIGETVEQAVVRADGVVVLARTGVAVEIASAAECRTRYTGRVAGVEAGPALDLLHYASAGAVGFARSLNDTPKMVALLVAGRAVEPQTGLVTVTVAMALGGLLAARRVAETMSRRITRMSPGQGLVANLVTAALVVTASRAALPVSTTHVSVGALTGIGVVNGTARWRTLASILVAWVTTVPAAAALSGAAYAALAWFSM